MIEIVKGATVKIRSTVYSDFDTLTIADITGASIRAMLKKSPSDRDSDAVLTKNVGSGISITDGAKGLCEVTFSASETNGIFERDMFFEILVKLSNGEYIRSGVEPLKLLNNLVRTLI